MYPSSAMEQLQPFYTHHESRMVALEDETEYVAIEFDYLSHLRASYHRHDIEIHVHHVQKIVQMMDLDHIDYQHRRFLLHVLPLQIVSLNPYKMVFLYDALHLVAILIQIRDGIVHHRSPDSSNSPYRDRE